MYIVVSDYVWTYEEDFTGNGDYITLSANQYRVVLRTGVHNLHVDGEVVLAGYYDYHFWYQTYDGRWANKHGKYDCEWLPAGTTPFSTDSSGWALNFEHNDEMYTYDNFYDGIIYCYIITTDS